VVTLALCDAALNLVVERSGFRRTIPFRAMPHDVDRRCARFDDVPDNPNMSMKRWLQSTRRCDPSYSTSPCVMLLRARSSCCFCDSSRCCDSRFCRLICRMISSSVNAIAAVSPQAPAIMARVWSLQSVSTLAIVVVATTVIG
jgi:hypothetical protein